MGEERVIDYKHADTEAAHTQTYLWGPVTKVLEDSTCKMVFDLGCGNGAFARHLKSDGFTVSGVDPSEEGIRQSHIADPTLQLELGNAYEPLVERFGTFPALTSLEVVEHVYYPRKFARCVSDLLEPGGIAIVSTPYHSYLKNLSLALTGKMDRHFTALWDHGHIKFWSVETLTQLFDEVGLRRERVIRVGRVPILAKSMILVFRKL